MQAAPVVHNRAGCLRRRLTGAAARQPRKQRNDRQKCPPWANPPGQRSAFAAHAPTYASVSM